MTVTLTRNQLKKLLTNTRPGDKIRIKSTGEIVVQQTKAEILQDKYPNLIGQGITISDAAKKYGISRSTLQSWVYRSRYINIINDGYPKQINEAEVAYCVDIYQKRRATGSKAPLLDENGLPYELKHPNLANYRRHKK